MKYQELRNLVGQKLKSTNASEQVCANYISTLLCWMNTFGRQWDDSAKADFGCEFVLNLRRFKESRLNINSPATIKTKVSHINFIEGVIRETTLDSDLKAAPTFPAALALWMREREMTLGELSRKSGISDISLRHWLRGRSLPKFKRMVLALEAALELTNFELQRLLPNLNPIRKVERNRTEYSKRHARSLSSGYYLRDYPPSLSEEWDQLYRFKTRPYPPPGFERNENWRINRHGYCPSAERVRNCLDSFFGFCCLPADSPDSRMRGRGLKNENLTLALVAGFELVESYLDFMKERAGQYHGGTTFTIDIIASLLRKRTGFLWQHPELFSAKVGVQENECAKRTPSIKD